MAKQMSAQEANWQAMFAPGGTPESAIKSLNDASDRVLNTPDFLKELGQHRRRGLSKG
jgi:tripartite-type tricarboxylate transporter receptor subunit TctC